MNNREQSSEAIIVLPIMSDEDVRKKYEKGWSYFNIYSLRELRDIFILYCLYSKLSIREFSKLVIRDIITEERVWTERRVLENINALKNIRFISLDGDVLTRPFEATQINAELSKQNLKVFENIFFSYFRFNEISTWFIAGDKETHASYESINKSRLLINSKPIFFYSRINRFTDTFVYTVDSEDVVKYIIPNNMSHLMRFWDVYLKWGGTLGLIEKFSLSGLERKFDAKDLTICYYTYPFKNFDLISFIKDNFLDRNVFIPDLIYCAARKFRYSVLDIKNHLIKNIESDERLTYERTSEIFIIKGKQSVKKIEDATYLYPIIKDSYVSHIIIRK